MTDNRFDRERRTTGKKKKNSPLTIAISVIFVAIGGITSCIEEAGSCTREKERQNNYSWSADDYDFDYDFEFDYFNTNNEDMYPKLRITEAVLKPRTDTLTVVMENYGVCAQTYFPFITAQTGTEEGDGYLFSVKPVSYYDDNAATVNASFPYRVAIPPKSEVTLTCHIDDYQTEGCLEAIMDTGEVFITIFSDTAEDVYCPLEIIE